MYRLNNNKTYTRIYTNTHKRPSIARTFEAPHAFFPNHDPFSFPISCHYRGFSYGFLPSKPCIPK